MKIGIPRAFLYYKYHVLWETFFEELGIEYIVSPETNKDILKRGTMHAIDESCLSSKIYTGHVDYLIDKCDYIFIPRVATLGSHKDTVCSKFQAIYDVINNTYREKDLKILYYSIDVINKDTELKAFLKMGKFLGKKKVQIMKAYYIAKQAEKTAKMIEINNQNNLFKSDNPKILIVSHPYNIYDEYVGKPITNTLKELGCEPILACVVDEKQARDRAKKISKTLPWTFNKELVGAIDIYKDKVDGIILASSFPCGPDSLVNEMIIRRFKGKPIINLTLDGQEGTAGLETRLESFVDIIKIRKNEVVNE